MLGLKTNEQQPKQPKRSKTMVKFCVVHKLEDRLDGATLCYYSLVAGKNEKAAIAAFKKGENKLPTHLEWEDRLLERGEKLLFTTETTKED
jgi:hypothetical protein